MIFRKTRWETDPQGAKREEEVRAYLITTGRLGLPYDEYVRSYSCGFIYLEDGRQASDIEAHVWMDESNRPYVAVLRRRTRYGDGFTSGGRPSFIVERHTGEGGRLWIRGGDEIVPADEVQAFVQQDDGPILWARLSEREGAIFRDIRGATKEQMQEWWDDVVPKMQPYRKPSARRRGR